METPYRQAKLGAPIERLPGIDQEVKPKPALEVAQVAAVESPNNSVKPAVAESDNVAPSQRTRRFEVDPALRFSLMRRLRGSRDNIVGHYHSHPEASAAPSAYDASVVFEPDLIWVIVAVAAGRSGLWQTPRSVAAR